MATRPDAGKERTDAGSPIPRMVGDTDVQLVRRYAAQLPPDARILEFGPFLGGVTQILADYGEVHVVDRFIWSGANETAFPGIATAGASFRPSFETFAAAHGFSPVIHESDISDFQWSAGRIDLCFIDMPRSHDALLDVLRSIAPDLAVAAPILVKNALNPAYPEMMSLIEILIGQDILKPVVSEHPKWCNIMVLLPGSNITALAETSEALPGLADAPLSPHAVDAWGEPRFSLARLAERISVGDWSGAQVLLSQLPPAPGITTLWDTFEAALPDEAIDRARLWVFSEFMEQQCDAARARGANIAPDKSLAWALRAFWANAPGPEVYRLAPDPNLFAAAFERQAMSKPAQLLDKVRGKCVVEIGPALGLSAVGFVCAGVQSYLGIETSDLTPEMLEVENHLPHTAYFPVSVALQALPERIDLCLIHGVDAESDEINSVVQAIGAALGEDGAMIDLDGRQADTPRSASKGT